MDVLPLETILQIFSFTDDATWHNCRQTCSTIACMLKKRVFIIKSLQMKALDEVMRTLKNSKSDRLSVRFRKVPKATLTRANIRTIYEKLVELPNLTDLDIAEFGFTEDAFPLSKFSRLESIRLNSRTDTETTLPPNLTKYSEAIPGIIQQPSASQLVDLEFVFNHTPFDAQYCTNVTRLTINTLSGANLAGLTALRDLEVILSVAMFGTENKLQLQTTNLESLQMTGHMDVESDEISRNTLLTRLSVNFRNVKNLDLDSWKCLTRLREVQLMNVLHVSVTKDAVLSFINGLPNLENLTLGSNNVLTNGDEWEISPTNESRLTKLHVTKIPKLGMSRCTALVDVKLIDTIAKLSVDNVTSLRASQPRDCTFLGSLRNVKALWMDSDNYSELPNLEWLVVPSSGFSVNGFEHLSKLTYLMIKKDTSGELPFLASLTNLVRLHMFSETDYPTATTNQVQYLTNLHNLEELSVSGKITEQELDSLTLNLTLLTYLRAFSEADGFVLTRLTNLVELIFGTRSNQLRELPNIFDAHLPNLVKYSMDMRTFGEFIMYLLRLFTNVALEDWD